MIAPKWPKRMLGSDPRWLEMASAFSAAGWGLDILLVPGGLPVHVIYAPLSAIVSGWIAASVVLAAGLAQAAGVALDHQLARIPFAMAMGSIWLLLASVVSVSIPLSPTLPMLVVMGCFNAMAMVVLIRLRRESVGRR